MKRADVLAAAGKAVADRGINYGQPEDNFARIARRWNVHLQNIGRNQLTPADVAIMMSDVKLARLENDPTHADSWIDLAGYAACGSECATPRPESMMDEMQEHWGPKTEGGAPVIPAAGQIIEVKQQPGESMSEAICRTTREAHRFERAVQNKALGTKPESRHGFTVGEMVETVTGQRGPVVGFEGFYVLVNAGNYTRGGWMPENLKRAPKRTEPLT